jgi:hypothetical protein
VRKTIEEVGPRAQRCRLGKQSSDRIVGISSPLPQLFPIGEICALAQPIVGNCPTPSMLPISKPIIPCCITDTAGDSADKSWNRWPE